MEEADTAGRTPDDALDGGNLQVDRGEGESGFGSDEASTLILDPVLLGEGTSGALTPDGAATEHGLATPLACGGGLGLI